MVQRSKHSGMMGEFIRTLRVLVRGESLETTHKFDYDLSKAQYYDIISEKSASLFALSCKVGGMSRGFRYSDTLGHFGWSLGIAFQMIDDLDDMLSTPNRSDDCDLKNGYICLPLIHVLDRLKDGYRDQLINIIERADFSYENERFIASLCVEHDAIGQTHEEIHKHLSRAHDTLERFDPSEARGLLDQVIEGLKVYSNNQIENFNRFVQSSN
jgi:geranylgeranyl pyrophosphate synthase